MGLRIAARKTLAIGLAVRVVQIAVNCSPSHGALLESLWKLCQSVAFKRFLRANSFIGLQFFLSVLVFKLLSISFQVIESYKLYFLISQSRFKPLRIKNEFRVKVVLEYGDCVSSWP